MSRRSLNFAAASLTAFVGLVVIEAAIGPAAAVSSLTFGIVSVWLWKASDY